MHIEEVFNINQLLMMLFSSMQKHAKKKNIELIYDMDSTLPRNLRGNPEALLHLLTEILISIFKNTDSEEIILSLSAPKDFLYEELISFKFQNTHLDREKVVTFIEENLDEDLKILKGKVTDDPKNLSNIYLSIPFKDIELGFRRHYRLPDKAMLDKKILLACENDKVAQSIKKMFEYFFYDVDLGFDALPQYKNTLDKYNILIISEKIITAESKEMIEKAKESSSLRYVPLYEAVTLEEDDIEIKTNSEHFIKPITQEKVFDLIVSLYEI